MAWILDLDGVIWLADRPIPGAADAVSALRRSGEAVLFVTNNSSATIGEQEAKLASHGIPAEGAVVSSAMAAASLLAEGSTALVCGGPGVTEALERRGVHVVRDGPADAVVVGWHRDFDYSRLTAAFQAVHGGARLVGTNDDPTYPTPDGPIPGGGSILAAVATAAGVEPVVAGKPHVAMAELVRRLAGDAGTVVGDRPSTDGLFARRLGFRFALVLTGVTARGDLPVQPAPDVVADSLSDLVHAVC